ncbi:PBP1A family penicillin-binding protein [Dellaglioa carnosa]|uniref:PBP1A family penicillin-binding protein n=1 Tax=Dellaglioa carnosa TaxID=2995136 RepID=A0ABT4JQ56_9LACO|nr:PBP1A family penicillin-binding protein [Dellaglioa carnosa]MCZ2491932.1 PBP1A family penicillin-binding protein [Dellaglioa carnosa]MCZ2495083.1 PBP1A family penicillin-binding protein [Dellaglioa carnosa]MDK1731946.1 PBP1A family penicillin-binding protein [Dellaglioa carnosa]
MENENKRSKTEDKNWLVTYLIQFKNWFHKVWHFLHGWQWLTILILTIILGSSAYLTYVAKTTNVRGLKSALQQSTEIFDKDGDKAGSLYSQKGTYVSLKKISPNIQNAVLSSEDRNFYHEHGFSIKGMARAAVSLVKNRLMGSHEISGGGSTITQQLVKNAFLSQEQTYSRKAKEIFISIQTEKVYSKNDILTMYLNNAYFGNGVWGVQDASKKYFGKNASDLTVSESAVIAGMLTSPGAFNPIDHPVAAKQRRNIVLDVMYENKKISGSELLGAKQTAITLNDTYDYQSGYKYPYYFDAIISEAIKNYGLTESDIMNRGYKIYTAMDQTHQEAMQTSFDNSELFPLDADDGTKAQGGSVAINSSTGGVTAIVGGRGKHVFRGYNRATQINRQPGSTLKPIAVYAPALEDGYFYDSELKDKKQSYGSNNYSPNNYDNQYAGKIPMYQALALSKNAPAVWLLNKIGVEKGYDSVKKFGIPVKNSDKNLDLALGGLTTGVSPYEMASAYTAFANGGVQKKAHFITKIVDASGKTVVNNSDDGETKVMSSKIAKSMTSMMMGVFESGGTGESAAPSGYTIAGKTGSTEAKKGSTNGTKDQWVVGYTPDVTVATWVGFDTTDDTHYLKNLSGDIVNSLFKSEMTGILPNTAKTSFSTKSANELANKTTPNDDGESILGSVEKQTDEIKNKLSDTAKKAQKWLSDGFKGMFGN